MVIRGGGGWKGPGVCCIDEGGGGNRVGQNGKIKTDEGYVGGRGRGRGGVRLE
jgi:hypothetical protein